MVCLQLTFINTRGDWQDFTLRGKDLETVFDLLNRLVTIGCTPSQAYLTTEMDNPVPLPVEAFTGASMEEPLKKLQRSWEEILYY